MTESVPPPRDEVEDWTGQGHAGYLVVLEKSLQVPGARDVLTALGQIKGVVTVTPVHDNLDQLIATERVRQEMGVKLREALEQALWWTP